mmetsp:Transcript_3097/g.9449  ORF Transcript_3097/g.9449 Transcript_3097/m.9449 type:complete len:183 (+) Transcript_3097:153-701(+)
MSDSIDHNREPCPDRILDDVGAAFAMGAIGGSIWHFLKGARNSPRGQRMLGAIDAVKVKGPALGGSFAIWGGVFSSFDCVLVGLRGKEDPWNTIASGAFTGGVLVARSGPSAMAKSAAIGALLMGLIEGMAIGISRMASTLGPTPEEIQKMRQEMAEKESAQYRTASAPSDAESNTTGSFMS